MGSITVSIPYWNVNVPERQRTPHCPPFLKGLCLKDIRTVSTPDSEYHIQSWAEVYNLIKSNRLERFQRIPSQLRRYKAFSYRLAKIHGSIADFVLKERLRWNTPVVPCGAPFQYEDDIKILYNDWPYGLDPRIVHLVVWTKFELKADPKTGDLTDKARKEIDDFMTRTFRSRLPADKVMWFKNPAALKSIHAVEHFHVMMFDPDPDFIREITNGDVPQCDRFDM
ncbi:N-acetylglucosamine-induced 1-like protein [Cladobotryum mycophilum]|uniref:N-acetylglucosamine-induced 1-like protein n=1 Tax=Cladobotryum mycophilum TaxID=491253 RepID=A0ABR0SG65_9HYPO